MHIIIAILGALAAAFWAFTYFMRAANEGREAIGDVKGVIRRGQWNRRVDQRLIENLSDPRPARECAQVIIKPPSRLGGRRVALSDGRL
ncbi:hypothetical protein [Hyphococcus luteus]|uniref:Uncharacterized protein n=1 Tax=Hyphococcus luteus TaxID=2058213 RepID=A0A2S7K3I6_9PROT|nr:hypothetical protein [Marinicaulis flavus]PQA87059.1 hypothetical protein CW354_13490 [Marinicaulis flavus]